MLSGFTSEPSHDISPDPVSAPLASEECVRWWRAASVADLRPSKAPETLPVCSRSVGLLTAVRRDAGQGFTG